MGYELSIAWAQSLVVLLKSLRVVFGDEQSAEGFGMERLSITSTAEGGEATSQRISEGWAGGATGVMMYDTM